MDHLECERCLTNPSTPYERYHRVPITIYEQVSQLCLQRGSVDIVRKAWRHVRERLVDDIKVRMTRSLTQWK
jgi:hypothetical protein